MAGGSAGYIIADNLWHTKHSDIYNWVKRSWEGISNEINIESFKTCGISNILDSLEDSDKEN